MALRDLTGAVDFAVLNGMTGGDDAINEEVLGLFVNQADLWSVMLDPKVEGWRDGVHTIRGAAARLCEIRICRTGSVSGRVKDRPRHMGRRVAATRGHEE